MFPTQHHAALVEFAFKAGGSPYWKGVGSGGLSAGEASSIDYGSRLTDTLFGTGQLFNWLPPPIIDPPITLIKEQAPKHAMTPGGMAVETAQVQAYAWIHENTNEARRKQRESCMKYYEAKRLDDERSKRLGELHAQRNDGRPIPSPPPMPIPTRRLESSALTAFGKACHTYMDACSPAHYGWQRYEIPVRTEKLIDPETGFSIGEYETYDWLKFIAEGFAHKHAESAPPTIQQRDEAASYMRGAFLTTFGDWWFKKAVTSEIDRTAVYDFVKRNGKSWSEDIIPTQDPPDVIPIRGTASVGAISVMPPGFLTAVYTSDALVGVTS